MSDPQPTTPGEAKPKRGTLKALSIYLIAAFLWRVFTAAHEFPSPTLRNITIALDLLCVIGLIGMRIQTSRDNSSDQSGSALGTLLFWLALFAGLGLFAIRLNGTACWWTGHLMYNLLPRD